MIPEEIIRLIMLDITTAINHIHSKDWIHCDMKPDNVLISADGHVKLGDFGISMHLFEEKVKKLTKSIGTVK